MRSLSCFHSVAADVKQHMIISSLFTLQTFVVSDCVLEYLLGRKTEKKRNILLNTTHKYYNTILSHLLNQNINCVAKVYCYLCKNLRKKW